jgi:hypothetical protein
MVRFYSGRRVKLGASLDLEGRVSRLVQRDIVMTTMDAARLPV